MGLMSPSPSFYLKKEAESSFRNIDILYFCDLGAGQSKRAILCENNGVSRDRRFQKLVALFVGCLFGCLVGWLIDWLVGIIVLCCVLGTVSHASLSVRPHVSSSKLLNALS
jgi:hypothetical protein